MVRAKFMLWSKTLNGDGTDLVFKAVTDDGKDNASWSKWTPSGHLEMRVTNPAALNQFEVDKSYYLDFSPT